MRAVADRLGVAPNALYSHVESKAALVDAVLDDLIGEIPLPAGSLGPRDALVAIMRDSFDALVAHPDLVALSLARQGSGGANAWRLGDRMLELFADAGVRDAAARDGLRILLVHMMGCAAFATQYDRELGAAPPHAIESVRADYLRSLGWLLDGILR
jgi:AcrR family transcriptional regulator